MTTKESNKQFDDVKASLHTEALKLADELDALHQYVPSEAPAMIRRLVEELDRLDYDLKSLAKRYKALDRNGVVSPKQLEFHSIAGMKSEYYEGMVEATVAIRADYTLSLICDEEVKDKVAEMFAQQTKPLSDEEIDKVASIKMNQILMDLIDSEDWNKGCTKQHLVNFARAIEERHGIK